MCRMLTMPCRARRDARENDAMQEMIEYSFRCPYHIGDKVWVLSDPLFTCAIYEITVSAIKAYFSNDRDYKVYICGWDPGECEVRSFLSDYVFPTKKEALKAADTIVQMYRK